MRLESSPVEEVMTEFGRGFYIDAGQIGQALLYTLTGRPVPAVSILGAQSVELAVATPEDVILSKLGCYRKGGQASTRNKGTTSPV